MRNERLTPAELHNHLIYRPDTGELLRKQTSKPAYIHGKHITILDRRYLVRSVVWAMISGEYPKRYQVRCVDGNLLNLKVGNFKPIPHDHKQCRLCKEAFPATQFNKDKNGGLGVGNECKKCLSEHRVRDPEHEQRLMRRRVYNIDNEGYERLQKAQGGTCAICKDPERKLVIDHCHTTDLVRGLLCSQCNSALGLFKDDPKLLQAATDYLKISTPKIRSPDTPVRPPLDNHTAQGLYFKDAVR